MDSETVDLIYLDPPFNSKANYAAPIGSRAAGAAFKDTWTLSDVDVEWINLLEAKHPALYRVLLAAQTDSDKSYLAYMAVRLLELKRVLKATGSIYLHCDPTMSHYLKLVMDAVYGRAQFQNEIVWKRSNAKSDYRQGASHFGRQNDHLLFYRAGGGNVFHPQFRELDEGYVRKFYKYEDDDGRKYRLDNMLGPGGAAKGNPSYEVMGVTRHWRYSERRMAALMAQGRVVQTKPGNVPMFKRYLDESRGTPVGSNWADIPLLHGWSKERTGYPTQKPLALLERILNASSNEGDVVLDPFCGCATTLVAADRMQRQWVGIDISDKAAELVVSRIRDDQGLFGGVVHRRDMPLRTDLGDLLPYNSPTNRRLLYGKQVGDCAGCGTHFESRHLEIDHIIARAKGGTDHIDNLQLLCGSCNRIKGSRGMEYLRAKLQLAA